MTHWFQGKVTQILQESPTVKRFFIEMPDLVKLDFIPGQFITFDLPIGDKRLQRWRSYSIANAPYGSNSIELCIVRIPNGAASTYFFENVEVGYVLRFKGPDGTFCLPEKSDDGLVMICTGTGIAPFRSMLLHMIRDGLNRPVHLIFGCRWESEILYRKEMEQLAAENPLFKYDICLSKEKVVGCTEGYVHKVYLKDYLGNVANKRFYLCGWSKMIDEAVENLILKMGCERGQISYELYG